MEILVEQCKQSFKIKPQSVNLALRFKSTLLRKVGDSGQSVSPQRIFLFKYLFKIRKTGTNMKDMFQ